MFRNTKAFSGFSVDDMEKAKDFYTRVLGLDVQETAMPGMVSLKITGDTIILMYPKPDHTPATFTILNFPVPSIEQAIEELTFRGVTFEIYKEEGLETDEKGIFHGGGPKIAWFKDPAGNILSVVEQQ